MSSIPIKTPPPNTPETVSQAITVSVAQAALAYEEHLADGVTWAEGELSKARATHNSKAIKAWDLVAQHETQWQDGAEGALTNDLNAFEAAFPDASVTDPAIEALRVAAEALPGVEPSIPGTGVVDKPMSNPSLDTLWGDGKVQLTPLQTATKVSGTALGLGATVQQGGEGDCVLDATMASLLAKAPDTILGGTKAHPEPMIKPVSGQPNVYEVRFFAPTGSQGALQPEWVKVDDSLPQAATLAKDGQTVLAYDRARKDGQNRPIIGPALIEKAFNKFCDAHPGMVGSGAGYGSSGDYEMLTMEAFTGVKSEFHGSPDPTLHDPTAVAKLLAQSNAPQSRPITVGIGLQGSIGAGAGLVPLLVSTTGAPLVLSHEYTVLGTKTVDGKVVVTLRNPWGGGQTAGQNTDGVFDVDLSALIPNYLGSISAA